MSQTDGLQIEIEKELKQNGIKENATVELEQDFAKLMNEINADSTGVSEKFKEELEKIFTVFQVSMANEKIFLKLYKELKRQTNDTMQKYSKLLEAQKESQKELKNIQKNSKK